MAVARRGVVGAVVVGALVAVAMGVATGRAAPAAADTTAIAAAASQEPTEATVEGILLSPRSSEGRVVLVGELVGDYGFRSDGWVWSQINGDSYAATPVLEGGELSGANVGIGIRIPEELVAELDPPGGYRRRGPVLEVVGTWVYHDPDRGGESYLSAESFTIVEPGRIIGEGPDLVPLAVGLGLLVLSVGLWFSRPRPA